VEYKEARTDLLEKVAKGVKSISIGSMVVGEGSVDTLKGDPNKNAE